MFSLCEDIIDYYALQIDTCTPGASIIVVQCFIFSDLQIFSNKFFFNFVNINYVYSFMTHVLLEMNFFVCLLSLQNVGSDSSYFVKFRKVFFQNIPVCKKAMVDLLVHLQKGMVLTVNLKIAQMYQNNYRQTGTGTVL